MTIYDLTKPRQTRKQAIQQASNHATHIHRSISINQLTNQATDFTKVSWIKSARSQILRFGPIFSRRTMAKAMVLMGSLWTAETLRTTNRGCLEFRQLRKARVCGAHPLVLLTTTLNWFAVVSSLQWFSLDFGLSWQGFNQCCQKAASYPVKRKIGSDWIAVIKSSAIGHLNSFDELK